MIVRNIAVNVISVISFAIVFAAAGILASHDMLHPAYASTNPNLFVSAENSQWNNYFAGPQVIQVVVADPAINRLDQAFGEPTVTVNGKKLRMTQNTDGNWYAYFADRDQAIEADKTSGLAGKGLDFGQFCSSTSAVSPSFTETKGFTVARAVGNSVDKPLKFTNFGTCTNLIATGSLLEHVVRQNKTMTPANGAVSTGQIGYTDSNVWPIIQLYDFSSFPTAVVVDYQKGGGDQIVNLTFDRIPTNLVNATIDRTSYPQKTQVFMTIDDPQLNIDPTEEDSWTWGTSASNNTLYYQAFNRNGVPDADGTAGMQNLVPSLGTFMFDHNGKLTVNPAASNPSVRVIDFAANGKQLLNGTTISHGNPATLHTASIGAGSDPVTFTESGGVSTGVFGNWDAAKHANIVTVNSLAIRGQSATFSYNDVVKTIVGGFFFGSISQGTGGSSWVSSQESAIALTDGDINLNSKLTEHLNIYDPSESRIPTMVIGTPFTLSSGGTASETAQLIRLTGSSSLVSGSGTAAVSLAFIQNAINLQEDEATSQRPIFSFSNNNARAEINSTTALFIDLKTTMSKLLGTIHNTNKVGNSENFTGYNFLNYDLRSLSSLNGATGSTITNIGINLVYNNAGTGLTSSGKLYSATPTIIHIANSTKLQDFLNLNYTDGTTSDLNNNLFGTVSSNANIGILVTFTTTGGQSVYLSPDGEPMVIDFFSMGIIGDGSQSSQRINNGIYRFELGETGDNTGVFVGTSQYAPLNQVNIFDPSTYNSLRPVNHDVKFFVLDRMTQANKDAPMVSYLDLGQDGINTKIASQQDTTTFSGTISTDKKTYNIGDTVTVTLTDPDLDIDGSLVDIYTTVAPTPAAVQDVAVDTIGRSGLGVYSNGQPIGELADVVFGPDEIRWSNSIIPGDSHHTVSCFVNESPTGTRGGYATSLSASGFTLVETAPSSGIFTGSFQMPDQLCQDGSIVSSITQIVRVNYMDFLDMMGHPSVATGNSLAFPLKPGSISDIHTYPNGDTITIPFVSLNNTLLTIDYPEGVLFATGDPTNHNNTYVPEQPKPSDPICSTGQFYSESGQCLWAPDRCLEGILPDATGHCSLGSGLPQPTVCSNGNANNSAGFCFSSPTCASGFSFDASTKLCVPSTWPVDCRESPDMGYLNQEGWDWAIPHGLNTTVSDRTNHGNTIVTKANSTGFVVQWMMPRGLIVGYEAGVYYNPVNFYQNVPSDTSNQKYMFYQVDYGVGKLLGNRQGLVLTFEPGGSEYYSFIQLKEVPIMPGSKYWITGVLEPTPLANPPAYVVQIVQGTHSWIYKTGIDEINPRTSPVYKFQSFQDQWISSPFASNLTRDEVSYPVIISVENGNQISLGSFLTSAAPYYNLAKASINGSYKLLSPHLTTPIPSQPNFYTNSRDCQGFGNINIDVDEKSQLPPTDNSTNGTHTTVPTPAIPEFGPLAGVVAIVLIIFVIAITKKHPSFGN